MEGGMVPVLHTNTSSLTDQPKLSSPLLSSPLLAPSLLLSRLRPDCTAGRLTHPCPWQQRRLCTPQAQFPPPSTPRPDTNTPPAGRRPNKSKVYMMGRLPLLSVLLSAMACAAAAQPATSEASPETPAGVGIKVSFRPSVAIVVGIFTMIFSLIFLLLMYAKFCHPSSSPLPTTAPPDSLPVANAHVAGNDEAQPTGVAKPVIESLPFFRFAALRGKRHGLECAVCLARFDDADLLRLLPRCRHAFHLDCVDRWLESNASCPLCRTRVGADDAALGLKYAASARFVFGGSDRFDAPDPGAAVSGHDLLDIFVERVPSSRFEEQEKAPAMCLDRHRHRIVLSDVVFKSRWSDLNSADLIALDTEMLRSMSSGRFPSPDDAQLFNAEEPKRDDEVSMTIKEEMEKKRLLESKASVMGASARRGVCSGSEAVDAGEPTLTASAARMISSGVRSMSEIVSLPRLRAAVMERLAEEERVRRRWLPIARRTARRYGAPEVQDIGASASIILSNNSNDNPNEMGQN